MTGGSAKRVRGRACGAAGDDRLSALPDCLLHAIMSFLKARQVVQTSVLSKRWTHLWRSVPCLDLDDHDAEFRAAGDDHSREFANFVDNLLLFHDAPTLDAFRLRFGCAGRDESREADRWIRRAIKYGPAVLEVHLGVDSHDVRLPGLGACSHGLKRLHLSSVSLDTGFAWQVQSGCPVLEDLELKSCYCTFREITSHTLKIFRMDGCCFDIPASDTLDPEVVIITVPALVLLHLRVVGSYVISVKEATNLVQASFSAPDHRYIRSRFDNYMHKFLHGLSSVRILKLTRIKAMVTLDETSAKFPAFGNLRSLLLDMCDLSDNFKTLGQFLHNAPSLERLTLQHCKLSDGSKKRVTRKMARKTLKCHNLRVFELEVY